MYKVILYLIISLGLLFGYIKYIELRSIFFPTKEIEFNPNILNLNFEDIYFNTDDGLTLNGWYVPCPNAKYTLLFLHGNGGNISHRLDKISLLNNIGLNIFIIDYRGYGKSQGKPSEPGIYIDAQAAYQYLKNQRSINADDIVVYGESLGTAVTINLASKAEIKALILEGAFSSGRDMAKKIFPLIPNFLFSDSFNSLNKINRIKAAKLFLHSTNDEIVPFSLCQKLFDRSPQPKILEKLIGGHNTAFLDSRDKFISAITSFLQRL